MSADGARRALVAAALVLLGLTAMAHGQEPPETAPVTDPALAEQRANALRRVSEQLVCQCGCNMGLAECSHQSCPFALPERKRILEMLGRGMSEEAIIAEYVEDYGRSILAAPPTDGSWLDRAAWIVPWVLGLGGLALVVALVASFNRRARTAPAAPAPSDRRYLDRIERELDGGER